MIQILRTGNLNRDQRDRLIAALLRITYTQLGLHPIQKQIEHGVRYCSDEPENAIVRPRGGSKTFDCTLWFLLVCITECCDACWVAGTTQQLERFVTYMCRLRARTWMGAYFNVGHVLSNLVLTFDNESQATITIHGTSGPRAALLHKDEEGKVRKSDIRRAFEESSGMQSGARGTLRERHSTTLGLDTPCDEWYPRLTLAGLVYKILPRECPWISPAHIKREALKHPVWFMNLEYYCELDAPGGKIIKQFEIVDSCPASLSITKGGLDWNPSWGHAGVVKATDGVVDCVVDEICTTDLFTLAKWIFKWEQRGCKFIAESQGGKTMNKAPELRHINLRILEDGSIVTDAEWQEMGSPRCKHEYNHVRISGEEGWGEDIQNHRISEIEAASTYNHIKVLRACTMTIAQFGKWHYDPEDPNGLPASKQEDHHCDAYAHTRGGVMVKFG